MARGRPLALRCEFGGIHTSVFLHGCSSGVRVGPTAGNPSKFGSVPAETRRRPTVRLPALGVQLCAS